MFSYHLKCKKLETPDFIFTDDLLLFSEGDHQSIDTMVHALEVFLRQFQVYMLTQVNHTFTLVASQGKTKRLYI